MLSATQPPHRHENLPCLSLALVNTGLSFAKCLLMTLSGHRPLPALLLDPIQCLSDPRGEQ
jgi:hypothetical protein